LLQLAFDHPLTQLQVQVLDQQVAELSQEADQVVQAQAVAEQTALYHCKQDAAG
jgi:hypothetical protein